MFEVPSLTLRVFRIQMWLRRIRPGEDTSTGSAAVDHSDSDEPVLAIKLEYTSTARVWDSADGC